MSANSILTTYVTGFVWGAGFLSVAAVAKYLLHFTIC